jgi:translation initiation factor IF-3
MISFKVLLNGFNLFNYSRIQNNIKLKPLIYKTTNFRTFSKIIDRKEFLKRIDDSNKESKIEITLKDQNNKILGVKTKAEAELLAKKSHLFLIQENIPNDKKSKYPVFKLVSTKQLAHFDDNSLVDGIDLNLNNSETSAQQLDDKKKSFKKVRETKRLAFSAKVSENDLITKIKSTKKWVSKGFEIKISINSPQNDKNHLVFIFCLIFSFHFQLFII